MRKFSEKRQKISNLFINLFTVLFVVFVGVFFISLFYVVYKIGFV